MNLSSPRLPRARAPDDAMRCALHNPQRLGLSQPDEQSAPSICHQESRISSRTSRSLPGWCRMDVWATLSTSNPGVFFQRTHGRKQSPAHTNALAPRSAIVDIRPCPCHTRDAKQQGSAPSPRPPMNEEIGAPNFVGSFCPQNELLAGRRIHCFNRIIHGTTLGRPALVEFRDPGIA